MSFWGVRKDGRGPKARGICRGAADAEVDGVWGRVSPSSLGEGSREGTVAPAEINVSTSERKMARFGAFWVLLLL